MGGCGSVISDALQEWLDTTQFTALPSDTQYENGLPIAQDDPSDDDTSTD
jgi:hypothetical protein